MTLLIHCFSLVCARLVLCSTHPVQSNLPLQPPMIYCKGLVVDTQNTKSFNVKSLQMEPLVSEHLLLLTPTTFRDDCLKFSLVLFSTSRLATT